MNANAPPVPGANAPPAAANAPPAAGNAPPAAAANAPPAAAAANAPPAAAPNVPNAAAPNVPNAAAAPNAPPGAAAANGPPAGAAGQPWQAAHGPNDLHAFLNALVEILEGDPFPPTPGDTSGPWWVVYSGLKVGVLRDWNLVATYTHGVSRNRSRGFGTLESARDSWADACVMGTVTGPLSEHSAVPYIVSLEEAARRMHDALGLGGPPAAAPEAATPVADDTNPENPPAWVVIRGRRPGVQYFRSAYRSALGTHPDCWGFAAPSDRQADRMWLDNLAHVAFLPY
ncbi:hypothetical protein PsYK624_132010 [Phanerochaete sordida]|uniref:Uncharacterized protein n=1 Tax=Phanerochaete sordida TaxID=48140 RepID=A0A9P3GLK1_9APHY|nr:hypothetical protein PsYK624_132010 [Phanerochaete sordida]